LEVTRYPETRFLFDCPINPRIAAHVLKCNYDVLHVHGITPTITDLAILFGKMKRKPIILTYHYSPMPDYGRGCGRFLSKLYMKIIDRFIVNLTDGVVTTTRSFTEANPTLRKLLKRVTIIPWGVDTSTKEALLNDLGTKSKVNVLFVGQLKKYKGIRYLLEAVKSLSDEGIYLNLTIVGGGPEEKTLKAYSRALGISVKFTGIVSDEALHFYYSNSDIFVLPSISGREGFGLVILEAMSYGKPAIVTDLPGPNELVKDGYNGILVPPRDPEAIARAIKKLALDPELRRALSLNALKTARRFSWETVGARYENIYNTVLCRS